MRRLGLACAAVLLLSACQAKPEPIEPTATPATPHASSSTKSEPTAKPPKLPAIAKRNDATGAANFVVYWVKVSNYASLTGDTHQLRAISAADCDACEDYLSLYEKTYRSGGFIKGGTERLEDLSVEQGSREYFVRGRAISTPGYFKRSSHASVRRTPPETLVVIYAAKLEDGVWRLTQIGLD